MPGLSGLELLGIVRQRQPTTPVIIISGISDKEHAQGMLKLGAFDYLLKPFRLEDVEASVNRAIEHHRRLVEEDRKKASQDESAG
jgi:DNA-binding NtrC family response regulator